MNTPPAKIAMDEALEGASVWTFVKVFARLFSRGARQCEDARFLTLDVPLAPDEVRKILPFGLLPGDPPRGTLFVVNYTAPTFTVPYREAALLIRVRTLMGAGWHCCWMVMDDDTAMIYGRELLAYPKKRADIVFEEQGNRVRASVTRRGIEVFAIEAEYGAAEPAPKPVFDVKNFNVGGLGQLLAVNPIWMFRLSETIRGSYTATAKLSLQESRYDPISKLVAGDATNARFVTTDIAGARYLFPVGLAGPRWLARTFFMRYR
jgi:acetoacetate decarboxylase